MGFLVNQYKSDVWEYGSDFHYDSNFLNHRLDSDICPWEMHAPSMKYFYSGRSSLFFIIKKIQSQKKTITVWIPSYYCDSVIAFLSQDISINLQYYNSNPMKASLLEQYQILETDIVLIVNYFGFSMSVDSLTKIKAIFIEDHTHDPWSKLAYGSKADWCMASLRKTLPIPDGAVVWSPNTTNRLKQKKFSTYFQSKTSKDRFTAMLLKNKYLSGETIQKKAFLDIFSNSESDFHRTYEKISEISFEILEKIDFIGARKLKFENLIYFFNALSTLRSFEFIRSSYFGMETVQFAIVLKCKSFDVKRELRNFLVSKSIYPFTLWNDFSYLSDENLKLQANNLANSLIFLHCDFRYSYSDVLKVAESIIDFDEQISSIF
jgi:hypothetical protein